MRKVKITEVCDFQGGTQPPKKEWSIELKDGYVRMLQIRDFTQPEKDKIEYVLDRKTLKKCNEEDILIGRYGASIGKILTGLSGAYNVAIVKTIPDEKKVDRRYLYYVLSGYQFQDFIINVGSRAAQAGFNKSELEKFMMPLPPLEDQKRIAAILDAADALRQKDKALIAKYEELTQSLFLDMFGDPVTNPKGWKSEKLGSLTKMIGSGSTPKGGSEVYQRHGFLFIRSQNIRNNHVDYDDIFFIDEGIHAKMKRTWVKNEDVLLNITGASIGRVAIFYGDDDSANVNQHVCIIRLNRQKLNPKFLLHHLVQENYQNKIIGIGSGGTREAFNFKQIKNFEVVVPPTELQIIFTERVQQIEKQKQLAQQSLQKSEELFNSLLQRAFKGELTQKAVLA